MTWISFFLFRRDCSFLLSTSSSLPDHREEKNGPSLLLTQNAHQPKSEGQTLLQSDCPHLCCKPTSGGNSLPASYTPFPGQIPPGRVQGQKKLVPRKEPTQCLWLAQEGCVIQTVSLFAWLLESPELETGLLFLGGVGGGGWAAGFLDIHVSSTITSCFFIVFQPLLMTLWVELRF